MVTGAFGLAIVGLVFKTAENDDLQSAASEVGLPESEVGEVEGLLSGSQEAVPSRDSSRRRSRTTPEPR